MKIYFEVPSVPVAQPRARATAINGQARMYEAANSHPIHAFKASVRMAAAGAYDGPPIEAALVMDVLCVFPRPANMRWKTKPMPRVPSLSSRNGDADNVAKGVMDALNGTLYLDDKQVFDLRVRKFVASGDEQPHVEVSLATLEQA